MGTDFQRSSAADREDTALLVIVDCLCTQGDCRYCRFLYISAQCRLCCYFVGLMDGCLQRSFSSLGFHSKSSICVRRCVCMCSVSECDCVFTGVPVCFFMCVSVLKAEWQSPWLILHVKLKLAPPEHHNKLYLTTKTCPEMTAGRAPIPINPYFPLYSTHLLPFLTTKASSPSHTRADFILLYERREQFLREGENESKNLSIGRKGGRRRIRESWRFITNQSPLKAMLVRFFTSTVSIIYKKTCPHQTGYSKELLLGHSFVTF